MNEAEAVTEGLKNIGELGAIVVAALVVLVIALLLVIVVVLLSRRDMKEREAQLIREKAEREATTIRENAERELAKSREEAERANNGVLLQALVGHVSANQGINERLIQVLESANTTQQNTAEQLEKNTGLIKLAIAETGDKIRETREDIGGVANKVDLILPAVDGGTEKVLTQLGTVLAELGKMRTALDENVQQTSTSNAQLREVFAAGLKNISDAIVKIVVGDAAKAVEPAARDTTPIVQVIGEEPLKPTKITTNGVHKVDTPTSDTKTDEPKL